MELLAPHINVNQKQNQIDICTDAGQANQIKIFAQNSSLSFQKVINTFWTWSLSRGCHVVSTKYYYSLLIFSWLNLLSQLLDSMSRVIQGQDWSIFPSYVVVLSEKCHLTLFKVRAPPLSGHEGAPDKGQHPHPSPLPSQARPLLLRQPRPGGWEDLRGLQGAGHLRLLPLRRAAPSTLTGDWRLVSYQ